MWKTLVFKDMNSKMPLVEYEYAAQDAQYNDARRVARLHPGTYWEMKFVRRIR